MPFTVHYFWPEVINQDKGFHSTDAFQHKTEFAVHDKIPWHIVRKVKKASLVQKQFNRWFFWPFFSLVHQHGSLKCVAVVYAPDQYSQTTISTQGHLVLTWWEYLYLFMWSRQRTTWAEVYRTLWCSERREEKCYWPITPLGQAKPFSELIPRETERENTTFQLCSTCSQSSSECNIM